jgi:Ca-activated chloride channel homolog
MIQLERPLFLLLALLLPLCLWLRQRLGSVAGRPRIAFRSWPSRRGGPRPSRFAGAIAALALASLCASYLCVVAALAGPALATRTERLASRGAEIALALDLSPSMAAQDEPPRSRFETALGIAREFRERREGDSFALVGFGSEASLLLPPTPLRERFERRLSSLALGSEGEGTAIGMGIAVAARHLAASKAPLKAIVLITDGENNAGAMGPEEAARLSGGLGIGLYVIGLGRAGEAPIDYVDPVSGQRRSGVFSSGFSESGLRAIAASGGGLYLPAQDAQALSAAFRSIDSREALASRVIGGSRSDPLWADPLALALCLALFGGFANEILLRRAP